MRRLLAIALLLVPIQALAAAHIVAVTGNYYRHDGVTPRIGTVTFQLSATIRDAATGKTYSSAPMTVPLDGSGHVSVNLVANDDPEISPTGSTYLITEKLDGKTNVYNAVVPYGAGGTIDVATLAPSSASLVYGVSFAQLNAAVAAAITQVGAFIPTVQSYTMPTGNFRMWSVSPTIAGRAPFSTDFAGGTFGSVDDYTMATGYNQSLINAEGAFWDALETHYFQAGPNNQIFERYWTYYNNAHSVTGRPLYCSVDQATGDATMIITANGAGYINLIAETSPTDPAPTILKLIPGSAQMFSGYPITWVGGGPKTFVSATNNANTLTHTMLFLDSFDRLCLGSNCVVNTDDFAQKLGFFNTSPIVKQTAVGPWGSSRASIVLSNLLASYGILNDSTVQPQKTLTYSASMTPDLSQGIDFDVTATNGTAFTFNIPTSTTQVDVMSIRIYNTSGGALGAATFTGGAGGYRLGAAWTQPATGFNRAIGFIRNTSNGNFYESWRTSADVAN